MHEVAVEVSDQAVDLDPRIELGQLLGAALDRRRRHVDRHVAAERVRARHREEKGARLGGRARPELDQLLGRRGLDDLRRAAVEDRALAAAGVVLGQLGDPVEELGAVGVVEELRRELLQRRLQQAVPHLGRHVAARRAVQPVVDPDARLGENVGHAAHLKPAKIWRRSG